jgi:predicted ribosome quality control (RQC) complex YloA/Tae2 family protein
MFDVLTMSAITDELRETILDGRIQRIGLVDRLTLAAEVYARGRRRALVASADPQQSRLLLVDAMPSLDPNLITPFGLLLRKYLRGGVVIGVEQPPLERMVRLSIAKRERPHNVDGEMPAEEVAEDDVWSGEGIVRIDLAVEVMGRHSNLVLIDNDGLIMDSAKRVTREMSRVRPIQPKRPYELPPPIDRPDPRRITSASLEVIVPMADAKAKLADVLVRSLRGISPQMGKEIAFRATGSVSTRAADVPRDDLKTLASTIRGLFEPMLSGSWDPHTYEGEDGSVIFAAVPLHHLEDERAGVARQSMSEAAALGVENAQTETSQTHAQRRAQLAAIIDAEAKKVRTRLASLEQQHAKADDVEELRVWGETIYAYLWQIQPGDAALDVDGLRIPLDPALSGKENAAAYFDRYRRSQRAGEHLPARIEEARQELDYLEQLRVQVHQADSFAALESLRAELYESGASSDAERASRKQARPKSDTGKRGPIWTDADGNMVYVGRSGKENDHVTFTVAGPDDTWLHARGVPGSHVVVKWRTPQEVDEGSTIETAAALAAWYSSARESGSVEVDVAKRRYVKKISGAGPGMVTYRNERTILVRPRDESGLS